MAERPLVPGGTAPHALVQDIAAPVLTSDDHHHLLRVRRLRDGDPISVTDGRGAWRWCRFGTELVIDGPIECVEVPAPSITVAFALVKGEKPEIVVQKLTELGVDRIIPFVAEHSVVRWDEDKVHRNTERLRRVAVEAAMQSRRIWFPVVDAVASFAEVVAVPAMVAADRDGAAPTLSAPAIMIGPEGGWSASERDSLPTRVGLADGVLRSETAAITAGALLCALRARLVGESGPAA
ncbi:MAG: 16S rRNA (uracil(1498)-N(3))-methyltransferase [Acidobacteria bacterium]|nr:16S rRNA (uracil(1498)-N(3))-methyltransferase [Acidobacteriota bacterium]